MPDESSGVVDIFSRNLGRGKACNLCRRRKLRCDGARPVCSRCEDARTRKLNRLRHKGLSEEQLQAVVFPPCFAEDDSADTSHAGGAYQSSNDAYSPEHDRDERDEREGAGKHRRLDSSKDQGAQNDLFFAEILSSQLPGNGISAAKQESEVSSPHFTPGSTSSTQLSTQQSLIHLNHSSAMEPLPGQEKMLTLLHIAFDAYPHFCIFQPTRILERLAKGPDHEDYPHASALHAILAVAYAERPDMDEDWDVSAPPSLRQGAHYRHTLSAQQAVFDATHHGTDSRGFFDVTRAILLLCFKQYGVGDVFESYLSNSSAIRACIGLNLNKERHRAAVAEEEIMQQTLLPRIADTSMVSFQPRDALEVEEVRRTMLVALTADRMCCATTLWPCTLPDEDYTASLPRATLKEFLESTFTDEVMARPPLYLNSADFFSREARDAVEMLFKGTALIGKCAELISRLPRNATKDYVSSLPTFQRLESFMTAFQLGTGTLLNPHGEPCSNMVGALGIWLTSPQSLRMYDSAMIGVAFTPFACTMTLHEPFATLSEESDALCRGACRSVIAILRLVSIHAEACIGRLDIAFVLIFALTGRSLIRQLESLYSKLIAHEFAQSGPNSAWDSQEFTDSVSLLQADLEVILLSLKRLGRRWLIGMKLHDMLLKLLQFNPEHRLRGLFCV